MSLCFLWDVRERPSSGLAAGMAGEGAGRMLATVHRRHWVCGDPTVSSFGPLAGATMAHRDLCVQAWGAEGREGSELRILHPGSCSAQWVQLWAEPGSEEALGSIPALQNKKEEEERSCWGPKECPHPQAPPHNPGLLFPGPARHQHLRLHPSCCSPDQSKVLNFRHHLCSDPEDETN